MISQYFIVALVHQKNVITELKSHLLQQNVLKCFAELGDWTIKIYMPTRQELSILVHRGEEMRLAEKLPQTYTRWFKVRPNQTQGCTRIQKQQGGGKPCFKEFDVLIPEPQRPDLSGEERRPHWEGWVHGHWIWTVWRNCINCSFPSERAPRSCFRPGKPTLAQHLKA